MPYRHFNGTTDTIKFSRGACDFTGAVSILVHFVPDAGKAAQVAGIYECLNEAGALKNYGVYGAFGQADLEIDNGQPESERVAKSPGGYIGEGEWSYLCVTKAAGTAKPIWYGRFENENVWVHSEVANAVVEPSLMGTGGYMDIGGGGDGFFWAGGIAAIARWNKALTQAEVESLGAISHLEELATKSPKGLWLLNQTSPSVPVPDRTGNGAGQLSITGTTVVNQEPRVIGFATKEEPSGGVRMNGGFRRESGKLVIKPEGVAGKRREGLLRTAAGSLATKTGGTVARVRNGWPVTSTGQICVSAGSTIAKVRYGLPLDSAGRVVVSTNAGVRNKANFLRDSGNRLVTVEGS